MPVFLQEDTGKPMRCIMFWTEGFWWITTAAGGPVDTSHPHAWLARGFYGMGYDMVPGHDACDFTNIHWAFPAQARHAHVHSLGRAL